MSHTGQSQATLLPEESAHRWLPKSRGLALVLGFSWKMEFEQCARKAAASLSTCAEPIPKAQRTKETVTWE